MCIIWCHLKQCQITRIPIFSSCMQSAERVDSTDELSDVTLKLNNNNKTWQKNKWEIFPNEVKYNVVVSLRSAKPIIAQVPFLTHSVFTQHRRADCYRSRMLCVCDNSTAATVTVLLKLLSSLLL